MRLGHAAERQLHGGQCQNAQGQQVPCCMWQADSWAGAFIALNSVTLLWTMFLVVCTHC